MCLLSIIIPVYNAEKTIGRTIESLNKIPEDSKKLIEVIIVDDGAQDKCMDIVESMRRDLSHLQFFTIRQENQGTGAARNKGLEKSGGEWVFFLDDDDELASDPVPI